jgi:hypothetical protein
MISEVGNPLRRLISELYFSLNLNVSPAGFCRRPPTILYYYFHLLKTPEEKYDAIKKQRKKPKDITPKLSNWEVKKVVRVRVKFSIQAGAGPSPCKSCGRAVRIIRTSCPTLLSLTANIIQCFTEICQPIRSNLFISLTAFGPGLLTPNPLNLVARVFGISLAGDPQPPSIAPTSEDVRF